MKNSDPYKKIPNFWWDFSCPLSLNQIIVESDHRDYPIVAKIHYKGLFADDAIHRAEAIIKDFKAGRRILRKGLILEEYNDFR